MTKIKICGLRTEKDISIVNKFLPDYVGFVFAESKRRIDKMTAAHLKDKLDPQVKTVGVFVNEEMDMIVSLYQEKIIDIIQLHGAEDAEFIKNLREKTAARIIKAVRVRNAQDIQEALSLSVDYLLFDTYCKGMQGGSGESFDWDLIPEIEKPFFLAGGLDPTNVQDAIKAAAPYCVDVSSGVEVNGAKSEEKIGSFIRAVREEQYQ